MLENSFGAARTDSNLLPAAYKAAAHPHELLRRSFGASTGNRTLHLSMATMELNYQPKQDWSRRVESNHLPSVYQTDALPNGPQRF